MTNNEAIKYLIAPIATSTKPSDEYLKQKEAYELAIKALEERPQGDLIDKEGKTCIHCLNSEPYVCDIIWCSEHKKPTNKLETCEKFRRMV